LKRKVVQLPDGLFFFLKIQFLENHDHTFLILHPHQHREFGFPIAVIRLLMIRFAIRGLHQGTTLHFVHNAGFVIKQEFIRAE
jgi:hypothetical protein